MMEVFLERRLVLENRPIYVTLLLVALTERRQEEKIEFPKETMNVMIRHFEILIKDLEKLAEQEIIRKVDKRLDNVKKGRVRGYSIKEYSKYMKRKGINVR